MGLTFQPSLPSWWYNWRVTPNHEKTPPENFCTCSTGSCGPPPPGKQFIPMITGYLEEDKPWMDDINDPVDEKYDIILGFNEPNRPDHSDIPPEVAASAWIELQNIYPTKVGRASPTNHQLSLISEIFPDSGQSGPGLRQHQLVRSFLRGKNK